MKNWVVISKPIKESAKGLAKYLSYLTSPNHQNHKNKTNIIPLFGNNQNLYKRIIFSVADKELKTAKKRKGGRPISSFAQSYVFILPEGIGTKPTKQEWSYIAKELIHTLIFFTGSSKEDIAKHIFINIHDQKNPHLNLVVSKIINGDVKTELQKKSIVTALKKTFNYAVLNRLKISPSDYQPQTKRNKRYNSDYYHKNDQLINHINRIDEPTPEEKILFKDTSKLNRPNPSLGRKFN
ncbi:hypothetical protein [Shewanella sp. 4_MG-2023]|uniref:hypothetical protein n=1 Tax=Shewanella sp. 4_MG-2023 TaxID=3062652 RepID=UPI0026E44B64|nr:hypothetical protein [Shewanella sp. 4_MG-2023]MDO6679513.1 hypothetical protein [Shewanella sp. 4_MG-2023]